MTDTTLEHWLQRLESIHPREMDLGLERVGAVAARMDLLTPQCPVVTVAGTNGKGSTIAVMESVLLAQGLVTGASTSPHLLRFNERIRVAGRALPDAPIVAAFEAIDEARGAISLTYFEFALLASLWLFRRREVEVMLLEVGLGGRLDAANIIDPTVAVITSIALDHQQWLGETREQIAREKAGILRPGIPAVIADPEPPRSLETCIAESGAKGLYFGRDFHARDGHAYLRDAADETLALPLPPRSGLLAANTCAGLQALLLLGRRLDPGQVAAALATAQPGGRREYRQQGGRDYLLDVAHNPAAVKALIEFIELNPCNGRTIAIFSCMADKDIRSMIDSCKGCFDAWFLADLPGVPRAAPASEVAALLRDSYTGALTVCETVGQAVRRAGQESQAGDRLVVFGSFHTVGAAMQLLQQART